MEIIHSLSQGGDRSRNAMRRNGGLEIWQRGTSFALAAGPISDYTADGWYLFRQANEASVVSRVAGLTDGSQYAAKVQRNSGQTGVGAMYFGFPLDTDEIFPLLNRYLRYSFVGKAGANFSPAGGNLGAAIYYGTGAPTKLLGGAGYAGQTNLFFYNHALTTTAARFQGVAPVVLPSTVRQMELVFIWTPVGTAGADDSIIIDDVQLEVVDGPNQPASPFERMLFADELLLCLRHFFKTFEYNTKPDPAVPSAVGAYVAACGAAATSAAAGRPMNTLRFPVPMRRIPDVQLYNPVTAYPTAGWDQVRNANLNLNHTASSVTGGVISTLGLRIASTGVASGAAGQLLSVQLTADAGI